MADPLSGLRIAAVTRHAMDVFFIFISVALFGDFFFSISFFVFWESEGSKAPVTFCDLRRSANPTPYLVGFRSGAPYARVRQTELSNRHEMPLWCQ